MKFDLRKQTAKQVLALAKSASGLTNDEISEASGIPRTTIEQYFKASGEAFFPSLSKMPDLCKALGNTIIVEWIYAQLEDGGKARPVRGDADLLSRVNHIGAEFGDVCREVHESLGDGKGLDGQEAGKLSGELYDLEHAARKLRDDLGTISGQRFVAGKWVTAIVPAGKDAGERGEDAA